ncbi:nitrate/nitrite transporter NrtS [Reinekea blandensis]|uniref:Uncharacterized protein n=1 Tax=Reinekea blandensis MED297 TaxID=314283 RepID=A4BE24_9GAMM|nr:nitrate/nitrite transporter NrtS [Reinekea blandensis]EAR09502.1 hypothetical protein MED297_12262 [Reinekea blandensis MED297]
MIAPRDVILKGIKTALVVGSVLTVINQWSALVGEESLRWPALFLTYLVPFSVFIYSYRANRVANPVETHPVDTPEDPGSQSPPASR